MQAIIRFPNKETEHKALGKLIPRFSGKIWTTGDTMIASAALGFLATEGITFTVLGPAPYERITALRDSSSVGVQ
jgi:hypothetical protein